MTTGDEDLSIYVPMACDSLESLDQLKGDPLDYGIEPKFDGFRTIAHVKDAKTRIFSRTPKEMTGKVPHVENVLTAYFPDDTILDGELVAPLWDAHGEFVLDDEGKVPQR